MNEQNFLEERAKEELKNKTQKLAIIDKLKALGFTDDQIEFAFSDEGKLISKFKGKHQTS